MEVNEATVVCGCGLVIYVYYINPIRLECVVCSASCDINGICIVSCYLVVLLLLFTQVSSNTCETYFKLVYVIILFDN